MGADATQRGVLLVPVRTSDLVSCEWLTLAEGSRIDDRFVLQRLVAQSEADAVYDAWDEREGRAVELRLQARPSPPDPRLRHPGFLHHQDRGCVGAWYASVLDPGAGCTLAEGVARLGRLTPEVAVAVAIDLLEALEHAHMQGLVHGALSAERIHVGPAWQARIIGFPEGFGPLREDAMELAPPERWTGGRGDERSDIYAVGVLIYGLITGAAPFGVGPSAREGHFLRLLPPHPSMPTDLLQVLRIATDKAPSLRYPTAGTFLAELLAVFRAATPARGLVLGSTDAPLLPPEAEAWIGGGTLDPAPHRAPDAVPGRAFPALPALLLVAVCLLGLGLASLTTTAALGVWALQAPDEPVASVSAVAPLPIGEDAFVSAPRSEAVRVPVTFGYGSYDALPAAGFDGFVTDAKRRSGLVRLTGHTDSQGSAAANHVVGLGRAWSVGLLMVARGVEDGRIELASAGETEPIAPNDTARGRRLNRRVMAEMETSVSAILDAQSR